LALAEIKLLVRWRVNRLAENRACCAIASPERWAVLSAARFQEVSGVRLAGILTVEASGA
jgi:hypothetical protein